MVFVMTITVWSLALQALAGANAIRAAGLHFDATSLNAFVSLTLILLAVVLMIEAARALRQSTATATAPQ